VPLGLTLIQGQGVTIVGGATQWAANRLHGWRDFHVAVPTALPIACIERIRLLEFKHVESFDLYHGAFWDVGRIIVDHDRRERFIELNSFTTYPGPSLQRRFGAASVLTLAVLICC
jgi:hypothetical protein